MRVSRKILIEVGLFVFVGFLAALVIVFFVGRESGLFQRSYTLVGSFEDVSGLREGAMVQLAGLRAGYVEGVRFPKEKEIKNLEVILKIDTRYKEYIRKDSVASIQTQGLLGDKFILISRGSANMPVLEEGEMPQSGRGPDVYDLAEKGREVMEEMERAAQELRKTLERLDQTILTDMEGASEDLRAILEGMRRGEGTIGALLKDPSLYHDMRALMGRANRSKLLKNMIRATISEQEKETKKPLPKE